MKFREIISARIGNLSDYIRIPFSLGAITNTILAHLNTAYYHIHGDQWVYPTLADNIQLQASTGAWTANGAIKEVVPENYLTRTFDVHFINVNAISENSELEIIIYRVIDGIETEIRRTKPTRDAVQSIQGQRKIEIPQQPANAGISCKLCSSTANATTCKISLEGHFYGQS